MFGKWDRFRVEQVLVNLMSNALKYGPGKSIEVKVAVRDRGIGIAHEDQPRVFQRFERAVSSRHFGGLGLGLYIASEIVKSHRGEISVRSNPGYAASLAMTLPIA